MRALLIALALLSAPVAAGEVGRYRNEGGGAIVLTSKVCQNNKDAAIVYSYTNKGSMFGCWIAVNKEIAIEWSDGSLRMYPMGDLELSDEFKRWLATRGSSM